MASPSFAINAGTVDQKVVVAASGSITGLLDSIDGVGSVVWTVTRVDDSTGTGDYTLVTSGSIGQQVDFTAGALGTAGVLRAVINGGQVDDQPTTTTAQEIKWVVLDAGGLEVLVGGELDDDDRVSDDTVGAVLPINVAIRGVSASGTVTGTGTDRNIATWDAAGTGLRDTNVSLTATDDLEFALTVATPTISQATDAAGTGVGQAMLFKSQDMGGAGSTGADVHLQPGTGITTQGAVRIKDSTAADRIIVSASGDVTLNGNANVQLNRGGSVKLQVIGSNNLRAFVPTFDFADTVASPVFGQELDATASATADPIRFQAQIASGATSTGGDWIGRPGTGTTTDGELELQDAAGNPVVTVTSSGNINIDAATTAQILIAGTVILSTSTTSIQLNNTATNLQWDSGISSPLIRQLDISGAGVSGETFTWRAQASNGTGVKQGGNVLMVAGAANNGTDTGGDATVRAGNATTGGRVLLQDGGSGTVVEVDDTGLGLFGATPVAQSAAYTRNATIVEDRTLLQSSAATAINNNNVLAALIADLQAVGILG